MGLAGGGAGHDVRAGQGTDQVLPGRGLPPDGRGHLVGPVPVAVDDDDRVHAGHAGKGPGRHLADFAQADHEGLLALRARPEPR